MCTSSSLAAIVPQIETIACAGTPIVSTTEELAYPAVTAARVVIDTIARRQDCRLGTGVNPGFVMDARHHADSVCERVDRIEVMRRMRVSAGCCSSRMIRSTPEAFQARVDAGTVRHVGLAESITMIADALGWTLDRVTDDIAPKIAEKPVSSQFLDVEAGQVCGLIQDGVGYRDGEAVITLHMEAYLGAPESYDAVQIEGTPPLRMKLAGGVHGDIATASIAVNSIPRVLAASPGLHTMRSLPLPSFFGGKPLTGQGSEIPWVGGGHDAAAGGMHRHATRAGPGHDQLGLGTRRLRRRPQAIDAAGARQRLGHRQRAVGVDGEPLRPAEASVDRPDVALAADPVDAVARGNRRTGDIERRVGRVPGQVVGGHAGRQRRERRGVPLCESRKMVPERSPT